MIQLSLGDLESFFNMDLYFFIFFQILFHLTNMLLRKSGSILGHTTEQETSTDCGVCVCVNKPKQKYPVVFSEIASSLCCH